MSESKKQPNTDFVLKTNINFYKRIGKRKYYNLQIIYNYTIASKKEEEQILVSYKEAGKQLELLPYFEVKEVNRQTPEKVFADMNLYKR